jgi:hypothetical protein
MVPTWTEVYTNELCFAPQDKLLHAMFVLFLLLAGLSLVGNTQLGFHKLPNHSKERASSTDRAARVSQPEACSAILAGSQDIFAIGQQVTLRISPW